jgi:hypothetical protein
MKKLGKIATEPEYIDWLTEVDKVGGEFAWIRKTKNFPKNATGKERTVDEINKSVLNSFRVTVIFLAAKNVKSQSLSSKMESIVPQVFF